MKKQENLRIEKHWLNNRTGMSDFTNYRQYMDGWTDITGMISSVVIGQIVDEGEMNPIYIQCVICDKLTAKKPLLYADVLNYREKKLGKEVLAGKYFHYELLDAAAKRNHVEQDKKE